MSVSWISFEEGGLEMKELRGVADEDVGAACWVDDEEGVRKGGQECCL